jgi:hypothetical protein
VRNVEMADQVRSAQKARAIYTKLGPKLYDPAKSEFDTRMLSLFESIEKNRDDVDTKIEDLHQCWRREGFWQRHMDKMKISLLLGAIISPMEMPFRRKTASIAQLMENWTRVGRIVNGHRFSLYKAAPKWTGPPQVTPKVEEPTIQES